jgi:hypothetical protein
MSIEASMRFKQEMPRLGLSVERGTSSVPNDNRYHVVVNGDIAYSRSSQTAALRYYGRERKRLRAVHGRPEQPEVDATDRDRMIQQQRLEYDLRAMNKELLTTVVANARRKGGKGR